MFFIFLFTVSWSIVFTSFGICSSTTKQPSTLYILFLRRYSVLPPIHKGLIPYRDIITHLTTWLIFQTSILNSPQNLIKSRTNSRTHNVQTKLKRKLLSSLDKPRVPKLNAFFENPSTCDTFLKTLNRVPFLSFVHGLRFSLSRFTTTQALCNV